MHDLFTPDDRARINAAMASGSAARFTELAQRNPNPSGAMTWGTRVGGLVIGLILGVIAVAAIGIVGVVALIVLVAAGVLGAGRIARWLHRRGLEHQAQREVVGGYAQERGWQMVEEIPLINTTPLLRLGDRRACGFGVTGQLDEATRFAVGQYEYEEDREVTSTDSDGNTTTRTETDHYPFTIALITAPLPDLKQVELHRGSTGGLLSKLSGAISDLRPVPLESAEFNDAFRLMVADDADELAIRARFTPAVQVALIERGAGESKVEAENGVLLVARSGERDPDDFGEYMDVLGDAIWFRALLADYPPGRVPDTAALRALLLGPGV